MFFMSLRRGSQTMERLPQRARTPLHPPWNQPDDVTVGNLCSRAAA